MSASDVHVDGFRTPLRQEMMSLKVEAMARDLMPPHLLPWKSHASETSRSAIPVLKNNDALRMT